ncbi:MAG: transglutaminase domain-containing protein [Anaerovoracaceae bacterium]|nr:transglutaminase domain-containing protein [Anaerovoracaceae bacterium]
MRKKFLKCISVALMAVLMISVLPAEFSYAALDEVNEPAQVTTFKSSETFDLEYLRGYVTKDDDRVLKVVYRTPLETSLFRLSLYRIGENKGDMNLDIFVAPKIQYASDGTQTYNFTYYLNMEEYAIPDGKYNIYIRRCANAIDAANLKYTSSGVLNKNMVLQVKDGHVKLLRYMDVINYNREIKAIGDLYDTSRYLDQTLEDIRFCLRNPSTNVYAAMTADKISFIRSVSDRICNGASTDYEKLLRIYEYTAGNFYYDKVAFQTHSNQYADPYENIRSFEYGLTTVNSRSGQVFTTCQGYSAIFLALARAQGIPVRFVYGHRLAVPSNDWITESNINVKDHWWTEAYVNGRWIFVDPTVGTTNSYDSKTGKWTSTGLTNYTYFDPSEEQVSTSHMYFNIYPDYRYGYYLDNPYEEGVLLDFLNAYSEVDGDSDDYLGGYDYGYDYGYSYGYGSNSYGSTVRIQNGKLLNQNYTPSDKKTWGDGTKSHFMTDGRGNISQIQWSDKGFTGALNLPGLKSMKLLSSHSNSYTAVDLSGCSSLEKVFLYSNEIETLDMSNCYKAWYVRAKNNPMKSATLYVNGRNRTIKAGDHGTFHFTLDTRYKDSALSLYAKPEIGYKLKGIYSTGTGSLLSTKTTWHFTPAASGYSIRFTLNPNSYKYTLQPGDASDAKLPYIQAAAKRLEELGYYSPSVSYVSSGFYGTQYTDSTAGLETSYNEAMQAATVRFQVVNDLPNTGIIDKDTWSVLFCEDALPMVSEYDYPQVLADYQARKAAEAAAEEALSYVTINASSVAKKSESGKRSMQITWTADGIGLPEDVDGYEVWKSTSRDDGYTLSISTPKTSYKNTSGLKKGTRYYYKVRAYKQIGEKRIYSAWSNITYKKSK